MSEPSSAHVRRRRFLTEGLVGPHERLYQTSATFHAQVDALAALLPLWVEGMVVAVEVQDVAYFERLDAWMRQPPVLDEEFIAAIEDEIGEAGP